MKNVEHLSLFNIYVRNAMDYERGLDAFKQLAEDVDWYQNFAVHEAALRENLSDEKLYGPSEQTRRDRTRIVGQLNALAFKKLILSFNDLCLSKELAVIEPKGVLEREPMKLDNKQREQLFNALLMSFHTMNELAQMVSFGLDTNLDEIVGQTDRRTATFALVQWAIAKGRIEELIAIAHERVPSNTILSTFAERFALASIISTPSIPNADVKLEIEKIVNKSAHFANVEAWIARMSEIILTVCRVEIPTKVAVGTGFLVGPDLVMTNYHVVHDVIINPTLRAQTILRFDYKTDSQGMTVREGKEYELEVDWLIDYSPVNDLDYALLRVNGRPGEETIGGQPDAPERKWLTPQTRSFQAGQPLFVIQHPEGQPLKVAFDTVISSSATRLIYRTNTLGGSSGSPCFNDEWELVALHHAGENSANPIYNEGIPFSAILTRPNVKNALGIQKSM